MSGPAAPVTYETLRYEVDGPVAIITYDRPDRRNAWSLAMYREIVAAIEAANTDPGIRAIVVTHTGPVFCAGTDFKDGPHQRDAVTGVRPSMASEAMAAEGGWFDLLSRSKPVIGAVHGQAIGLGATQLLPMDLRVGGPGSRYVFPFLKVGFMPELGATALLARLVGHGRAIDLCLTAGSVDGETAERIGLISRLVPDERVLDEAIGIARVVATFGAYQVQATKQMLYRHADENDVGKVLSGERDAFLELYRQRRSESRGPAA